MTKKEKDQRHRPLSSEVCRRGLEAAVENALRYLQDAELLARSGRLDSAGLLGIYGLDELGKAGLFSFASTLPEQEVRWRDLRPALGQHGWKLYASAAASIEAQRAAFFGRDCLKRYLHDVSGKMWKLRNSSAYVEVDERGVRRTAIDQATLENILGALRSALTHSEFSSLPAVTRWQESS